jgi:hypothetical protein
MVVLVLQNIFADDGEMFLSAGIVPITGKAGPYATERVALNEDTLSPEDHSAQTGRYPRAKRRPIASRVR